MEEEKKAESTKLKLNHKSSLNPLTGQNTRNIEYLNEANLDDEAMSISD